MSDLSTENAERFRRRSSIVALWRIRSDELHVAAELVWHAGLSRIETDDGRDTQVAALYRPAQLLMGLSLEVLLKGLIIAADPELIQDDKLPTPLRTHSLEDLFKRAGVQLPNTEDGMRLIRQLSDAVEWVSKYPVPTKASHLKRTKHGRREPFGRFDDDFPLYEALRDRLLAQLPSPDA